MNNKKLKTTKILILVVLHILLSINILAINDTQIPSIIYSSPSGYINSNNISLNIVSDEITDCKYDINNFICLILMIQPIC